MKKRAERLEEVTGRLIKANFPELSRKQIRQLTEFAEVISFDGGQLVFNQGSIAKKLYFVERGCIFLRVGLQSVGTRINFASVGPSEVFGWSSMVPPFRTSADAIALKQTRAVALDGTPLLRVCRTEPEVGHIVNRRLLLAVAGRLDSFRNRFARFLEADLSMHVTGMPEETRRSQIWESLESRASRSEEDELTYLTRLLRRHSGSITAASEEAQVHRTTLYRLMKKYALRSADFHA